MSFFHEIRHERIKVSFESYFNGICPLCNHKIWKILDSWIHSVAEMGSPTRKIMADVEMKRIQCQKCGQIFTPEHPQYPKSYQVSGDVIQYALGQAHKYTLSASQIASMLSEQHQVKVMPETVQSWINDFSEEYFQAYFQKNPTTAKKDFKAITIDGTHFNMGQDIIGKKGCALVIGDQADGRNLLTDLVGVENKQNAVQSLKYLFEEREFTTEIAVCDLSPNLLAGLSEVLGDDKIAIDPFHVMQELNRAILKDIARYRVQLFTAERKDLAKLKHFITTLQKVSQKEGITLAPLLTISPHHQNAQKCLQVTQSILGLYQLADPKRFFSLLNDKLDKLVCDSNLSIVSFGLSIKEKLPKKAITQTAMMRLKPELLKKLKTLYREYGEPLKNQQYEYSKQRWTLFYQPERLTPKRVKILTQFLSKYPDLQCYRDLTLSVGSIYRLPNELVSSRLILDLVENPKWGNELRACLSTFKKWADAIIRFKSFFENHQGLPKRLRANMEYQNPKIKKIFRSGNNMKGLARIQSEVQFNLGGEVRNFLKAV